MSNARLQRLLGARLLGALLLVLVIATMATTGDDLRWTMPHYIVKPLATITVLLIAWTAESPVSARYRYAVVAGMLLSLVGDVLLMLPQNLFAAGLGAFLLAHCCYIFGFLGESRLLARPAVAMGFLAVAAVLLSVIFPSLPGPLRIPVVAYVGVITLMAIQSATWSRDAPSAHARRAALGAVFFLVSDATLAIARFRMDVPYRDIIVPVTYYIAQWCLARSVSRRVEATSA